MDDGNSVVREIQALREDFREFSKETRATLRICTDPISGYVPRSEVEARFKSISENTKFAISICVTVCGVLATLITLFLK